MNPFAMTTPCADCPFRADVKPFLRKGRVTQIERALERGSFHCHKSVDYEKAEPNTDKAVHCAGALILLERLGRSSQVMRVAERLGLYDPSKLDMDAPVFSAFVAMRKAQRR